MSEDQFNAVARSLAISKAEHRPAFERLVLSPEALVDTACLGVLCRIETALYAACNLRLHRKTSEIADVAQDMVPLVAAVGDDGNLIQVECVDRPLWQLDSSGAELDVNLRMPHQMPESTVVDPLDEAWLDGSFPSAALPRHGFLRDEMRDVAGARSLLRAGSSPAIARSQARSSDARRTLHTAATATQSQFAGQDAFSKESMKARLAESRAAL